MNAFAWPYQNRSLCLLKFSRNIEKRYGIEARHEWLLPTEPSRDERAELVFFSSDSSPIFTKTYTWKNRRQYVSSTNCLSDNLERLKRTLNALPFA